MAKKKFKSRLPPPEGCRFTELEASAVLVLITAVGMVGANALHSYFKRFISKQRALELEGIVQEPTDVEANYLVALSKLGK